MLLALRFFDAKKCCLFPSQVLQLLSCPRNRIQCWKATPGSGPWRLKFRIEILWGRGGPHAAGTSSNIFKRQKCDFFHRFFRDRSVHHKDSQSVILRNRLWRRISATGRSRRKFYFSFCRASAHMRSLDGGSLHDSTKSPKSGIPDFDPMAHRWPIDGPPPFRVIYTPGSNTKCTKQHISGNWTRPGTLLGQAPNWFISAEKIHRYLIVCPHSFTRPRNFNSSKRPAFSCVHDFK